jgi:O-antigen ligase
VKRLKLPLFFYLIFIMTGLTLAIGQVKIVYRITGWGWFLPLVFSMFVIISSRRKINFPCFLWLPWGLVVSIYFLMSDYPAFQRSMQLLTPVIVGMAASMFRFDEKMLSVFIKYCRCVAFVTLGIVGMKSGLLLTGNLPDITGLAPEVMTGALLGTLFATQYTFGNRKALFWWVLMSCIPIVALTRTGIVASGLTLPLNLGPLKMRKRIFFISILCIIGVGLFYTPRVQRKMFYSGSGEMSDVLNQDFRDTGRFYMWEAFADEIKKRPWFGYGIGAGEEFTRKITFGIMRYPHNDWYLSLYDFGIIGTAIFTLTILVFSIKLYRRSRSSTVTAKCLFIAGASSFIPFALFMFTDNIMVYASFFGNLQFTMIGIAYGAYQNNGTAD